MTEEKKRGGITIEDLLADEANDLEYQAMIAEQDRRIAERYRFLMKNIEPLTRELNMADCPAQSLDDVMVMGEHHPDSIPILAEHVDRGYMIVNTRTIVRGLGVPAARGLVNRKLLRMFREVEDDDLRWVIGLTLETVADIGDEETIRELLAEHAYGGSRDRLIGALGRLEGEAAIPLIRSLLKQPDVCVEAINALGDLRAVDAYDEVEALTKHEDSWVRKHARRALRKIDTRIKRLKANAEKERLKESRKNEKRSPKRK
jgi:hypothetical protein